MYKVLMFGSRDWNKAGPIKRELRKLVKKHGTKKLIIIEGECRGADQMCRVYAEDMSIHVARVAALWNTRHGSAGPQRNSVMAALEPDEGIGFQEKQDPDSGTWDMKKKLDKLGIPARIVER